MVMANQATVSDQKKRAFDALERRFIATAAEKVQSEQLKSQKRSRTGGSGTKPRTDEPSSSASVHRVKAVVSGRDASSQKKTTAGVDGENHPIYTEISESIHENLLQGATMDTNRRETIERIVSDKSG